MQRSSSLGCVVSLMILCVASIRVADANPGVAGASQWDVTSFQVNLMNHQGANGDIQTDQNGWIHLGANHLEGGDITYQIQVGRLAPSDILEVWIDGFSNSNDLAVGPTVFIGVNKNRSEQITRVTGEAWRPFVFRFADERLYGDVTDPSNRNETWRVRYPSSKYEVRRVDSSPDELLSTQTLPVRISMTGIDDFIIKRLEVVVYRSGGGIRRGERLLIASLAPYRVTQGNRVTVQFNQSLPEKNVDFYVIDPYGRESRIYPQITNAQRDAAWFYADGDQFYLSGDYQVKVVDRSIADQAQSDAERFEYSQPRVIVERPKPTPTPRPKKKKKVVIQDECALPPCPTLGLMAVPAMPPAQMQMQIAPQQIVPMTAPQIIEHPPVVIVPQVNQPMMAQSQIVPQRQRVSVAQAGGYTIQIGAFTTQQGAVNMMNKLRGSGYDAYISQAVQGRANVYRVRVGRYPSKSHAAYDAARLQQSGFETWITTLS